MLLPIHSASFRGNLPTISFRSTSLDDSQGPKTNRARLLEILDAALAIAAEEEEYLSNLADQFTHDDENQNE